MVDKGSVLSCGRGSLKDFSFGLLFSLTSFSFFYRFFAVPPDGFVLFS